MKRDFRDKFIGMGRKKGKDRESNEGKHTRR